MVEHWELEPGTQCKHKIVCLLSEKNALHFCKANFSIPYASTGQALYKNRDQLTVESGSWDVEHMMTKHQEMTCGGFVHLQPTYIRRPSATVVENKAGPVTSLSLHWF